MSDAVSPVNEKTWDKTILEKMWHIPVICREAVSPTGYENPWHSHVGIGMVYCRKGHGLFRVGTQTLPYAAGDLIYFDSRISHRVSVLNSYERWDMCFWTSALTARKTDNMFTNLVNAFSTQGAGGLIFKIPPSDRRRIENAFSELQTEVAAEGLHYDTIVQLKLAELHLLLERFMAVSLPNPSNANSVLSADTTPSILSYIEENLQNNPSVQEVALHFHYSASHLTRVIRKATGETPNEYIQSRKLERARALLTDSNLSIAAIAESVGLCNSAYLSRLFRRATGLTPSEYRDMYSSSEALR